MRGLRSSGGREYPKCEEIIISMAAITATAPAVRTRITSLFGCKYPILLPGMSWISSPTLVAAVSNAGEW